MILIIDNEDPAINVLANALRIGGAPVQVEASTDITLEAIRELRPSGLVFSEGAGAPEDAGIAVPAIKSFASVVPILGVGLGHRAIGAAFGASITRQAESDATGTVQHDERTVFHNISTPLEVSSSPAPVLSDKEFPVALEVSARTPGGTVMGVRHRGFKTEGIQFRLEEMEPAQAEQLVRNWLNTLYDIHDEAFDQLRLTSPEPQTTQQSKNSEPEETVIHESGGKSMFERAMEEEERRKKNNG